MINPVDLNTAMFNVKSKTIDDISNYPDLNNKSNHDEALRKAASDFESVFVAQLLDIMDSTVEKGEFMNGGHAEKTFKSMLNQEIAKNISSTPATSFGFAEQIYRQMKDQI